MKTLIKLGVIIFFISFVNTGCEKIKDLADVSFDANFDTEMNVDVKPTTQKSGLEMGSFSETAEIDPNSNEDFKTYASKIKDIKVTKVVFEIIEITNAPNNAVQLGSATLSVDKTGFTSAKWIESAQTLTVGKKFEYSTLDQFANLQNILNSKVVFTVNFFGTADPVDASFKVKVTINSTITANPLN
jgi:hypothetical protein